LEREGVDPDWAETFDGQTPSLAIGLGLTGWAGPGVKGFGPGRAAQVASPGSPKKPEIKPEELSLLFYRITRYHSYLSKVL